MRAEWSKNAKDRSNKFCCCGGHNHKNVKKNKNHHATASKLYIRRSKRCKGKLKWDQIKEK